MPRRKKKDLKLNIRKETVYSIAAVVLILLGVLVMVSFSGQGMLLSAINNYFVTNFGLAMLFLPFICISSGLVLFQADWAWTKPHVLLGTLLNMVGIMGVLRSGVIGAQTFDNVALLISPYGAFALFLGLIVIGVFCDVATLCCRSTALFCRSLAETKVHSSY